MKLRFYFLAIALCLSSIWYTPISARIHPNISPTPPWQVPNDTAKGAWDSFKNFTGCRPGQKSDGLSKLKDYFKNFGYIPDSQHNFTDDFDDELESAIKTYQKNFNLNVTGELDDKTIENLMKSRCGNADIVNGTSTMNSGKPASSNSSLNFHAVRHYSFFEGRPTWPEYHRDLTYAFLPDNELSNTTKEVFTRAFERWAAVTTLTFTETDSYYEADLKVAFYTGDHGDGEPFDGVLGTLAHAFSPTSGRFHLDGAETWVAEGDVTKSSTSSAIDLESVAVHEIGHLLGLGHSSVEEAIMYPTISAKTRKVELASDDIQGIQELYGANSNYTTPPSSSSPNSHQENTSNGGDHRRSSWRWDLGFLSSVGLGLLLL
ncbi:Metalloendoproteinase 1 [Morus notabilis]|uniref:Metalloendoproteinase 1 n=1 Tax=Morus notabilis TaxID=981085 RepID=W9S1Y5_9ROSA|nr:metalloendoproteinase 2-MMP [Morus notabilis]EXB82659.1 Metalloendoproteinase 1 [Morus notabilis]